jgi:hypothetical protein
MIDRAGTYGQEDDPRAGKPRSEGPSEHIER